MKVALVNANPAVSRLATLSLNKMGCEYMQASTLDELSGRVDVMILDSDVDVGDVDLREFADKILYLAAKNQTSDLPVDKILPKPFLPTEFIAILEALSPAQDQILTPNDDAAGDEADEFDLNFDEALDEIKADNLLLDEAKFVDELDDIFGEEPLDTQDDEFKIDDEDLTLDEEPLLDQPTKDDSALSGLSDLVKSIDDMSEDEKLIQNEPVGEILEFGELAEQKIDEDLGEFSFDDIAADMQPEALDAESAEFDSSADTIRDIKNAVDEIDHLGLALDAESEPIGASNEKFDEILDVDGAINKNLVDQDEFAWDEPSKQDIDFTATQALIGALEESDDQDDLAQDDLAQDDLAQDDLAQDDLAQAFDEIQSEQPINQKGMATYDSIDQISQSDMAMALGESVVGGDNKSDIKSELTEQITRHIASSLDAISIKELLKGMNIKINISFEEK